MGPKLSEDGPKLSQDGPKLGPSWTKLGDVGRELSQDGVKMGQVGENLRKLLVFQGFSCPGGVGSMAVRRQWTPGSGLGKIEIFIKNV